MIGATTSQTLDLTLINNGDIVYGTSTIKVEIGLKIGSTIEYIPIGIYNIDDIEKNDYTIKITAFDNMIKFEKNFTTTLGDVLTLQQVVSELTRITGVAFTGSLPSYTVKKLEGFSCREVLGYVASICGGNAVITRDGKFTILTPTDVNYSIGTSNYFEYKREESKYKIGKISCQVGEEVLSKGSLTTDSMELEFENPWITDSILQDIYNKLNGFEYLGYSMKWQGDLSLDIGDIVTITDKKGVVRKHPILSQKFTYTGGLTSEIGAKGETKNKNSFSSSGSTAKKVERAVMELAIINKALIDVAYIGDLTAGNIKFDTASGTIMDLQTLLSKHITGENGQFLNITSSNTVIANAVIKDAMIENLSLNKVLAGTISTNKFNISSDDGGISIVGPTMQFKDKNNKVRIQMGQDATGNFNFILRGEDGTTTLIDHTGIKEKAIADDLIKENMVAADAIGEKQINYSSFITGLNKDTNTSLIKASKVAIDLTGQSLEVAFNTLKTNVDNTQIGGRNYIRDYQFKSEDIWKKSRSEANIDIVNGYGYLTSSTLNPYLYQELKHANIKNEDTVTLQYEIKFENVGGNTGSNTFIIRSILTAYLNGTGLIGDVCTFGRHESDGLYTKDGWQKVVKTMTINTKLEFDFLRFRLYARNFKGNIYFRNVKLEKGNKATDLSEAPEDASEKIEANTTSIKTIQGNIETLIKNTTIEKDGTTTTLKDAYSTLSQTVGEINSTVASHTSSITTIQGTANSALANANTANSKIDNLEIGGTNLQTNADFSQPLSGTWRYATQNMSISEDVLCDGYKSVKILRTNATTTGNVIYLYTGANVVKARYNDEFTMSFEYFIPETATQEIDGYFQAGVWFYKDGSTGAGSTRKNLESNIVKGKWTKVVVTGKATDIDTESVAFVIGFNKNCEVYISKPKLEKGNRATDFTIALGDINTKVTTVENKYTSLSQSLDGFKTTVSNTYSTKTELSGVDGRVSSLTSRVSTAESSITQLNDDIKLNVSNLKKIVQEGNRNLVVNSNWFKGYNGWKLSTTYKGNYSYGTSSSVKLEDKRIVRLGNSGENPLSVIYADSPKFPVSPGEKITYGAFGAVTSNVTMQIYLLFTDNTQDITENNSYMAGYTSINFADNAAYTKKNNTATVPEGATRAFIRVRIQKKDSTINTGSSGVFSSLMVRKGEEVFEWCPSQGDSYTYIDEQTANLQVSINSITGRVSNTETSISTINGNITSLQSRMSTAESKITDSSIINAVQNTINNAMNSAINSANSNTDVKLQSYATKASMELTSEQLKLDFSSSGGYNIVKNSGFKNGLNGWGEGTYNPNGSNRSFSIWDDSTNWVLDGTYALCIRSTNNTSGEFRVDSQKFKVKRNTTYTLSYLVSALRVTKIGHYIRGNEWDIIDSMGYCPDTGGKNRDNWTRITQTFNTGDNNQISLNFIHFITGSNAYSWVTDIIINEGEIALPWSPHPDEVYSGNTIIDASGVNINNGGLTVKNNNNVVTIDGQSNIFKIHSVVDFNINAGSNLEYDQAIYHGLGYVPAFCAFQVDPEGKPGMNVQLPAFSISGIGSNYLSFTTILRAWADSGYIYITYIRSNLSITQYTKCRIYIYKESLI